MHDRQTHYARLMVENGCTIEDVCATLGMRLHEAIYAVAPALKANPDEQKRVRRMAASMKLPGASIHTVHSREGSVDVPTATLRRNAA